MCSTTLVDDVAFEPLTWLAHEDLGVVPTCPDGNECRPELSLLLVPLLEPDDDTLDRFVGKARASVFAALIVSLELF